MNKFRRSSGLALAALLVCLVTPSWAGERVRLLLHTGERLEGRVYDIRDQYLEVHRSLGSKRLAKSDVANWVLVVDPGAEEEPSGLVIVLRGGHEISGKIRFVEETLEWIVDLPAGQARYPENEVLRVIPPSGMTSDDRFTPRKGFDEEIAAAIADVRSADSMRMSRGKLFLENAGYFALRDIQKSIETDGPNPILRQLSIQERFRVVIPDGIEEILPNLTQELRATRPETRVAVLREALIETGADLYPLLGLMLLDREQPSAVRSFAIDVLGRMHQVRDLLIAYPESEGRAQIAIAIALGDNGVYLGIPTLIDALELPTSEATQTVEGLTVQELAVRRLREYSGETYGFQVSGTEEERKEAIAKWREWWTENRVAIEDSVEEILATGDESPRRRRAADLWRQGQMARARGQLETATTFFERARKEDPTSAAPLISLGIVAYTWREDHLAAIDYFRQALSRPISEGQDHLERLCYFHLGRIYQLGRDYDMAVQALAKSVEVDPSYSQGWYELGMVQYRQALLLGGDEVERRRGALIGARDTFAEGVSALESYRENQSLLDLNSLPFDEELPFSSRDHNRSLRDIREQLQAEIARFHYQMAVISVALGETRNARTHIEKAKDSPNPPEGIARLERAIAAMADQP